MSTSDLFSLSLTPRISDTGVREEREMGKKTLGVVVSTYGSPAFVALQLESLRRLALGVPVLVHDDCSQDARLPALTLLYGAAFQYPKSRQGHTRGDVESFVAGLLWAESEGLDHLVKISRRFIPVRPWLADVNQALKKAPTAGAADTRFDWRLRTEFIGLDVQRWLPFVPAMRRFRAGFVEDFMYRLSHDVGAIAALSFLGESRAEPNENFLWYSFSTAEAYSAQAKEWGLNFSPADFDVRANLEDA